MNRTKSDSISKMGLEKYFDTNYSAQGGYKKLVELIQGGASDSDLVKHFGKDHPQSGSYWRKIYAEGVK